MSCALDGTIGLGIRKDIIRLKAGYNDSYILKDNSSQGVINFNRFVNGLKSLANKKYGTGKANKLAEPMKLSGSDVIINNSFFNAVDGWNKNGEYDVAYKKNAEGETIVSKEVLTKIAE